MDRLLREGDLFRFESLDGLRGEVEFEPHPPHAVFGRLVFDNTTEANAVWTERRDGGWSRMTETRVDLDALAHDPALKDEKWEVCATLSGGGGTAHGPGDTYPDGHHVRARSVDGKYTLSFFQSGCFTGMRPPPTVVLCG